MTENVFFNDDEEITKILNYYTDTFSFLYQYDSNNLNLYNLNSNITYEINYTEAKLAILKLKSFLISKNEASQLFGNEKDKSFEGSLISIIQTFDGEFLYNSIEEQASNLLYFIIKNHPFSDGNKRIGAFLFIWFLKKNKHQFTQNVELKINNNALTAIALLVAQSNPNDKDLIITLICNLIKFQS